MAIGIAHLRILYRGILPTRREIYPRTRARTTLYRQPAFGSATYTGDVMTSSCPLGQ